MSLTEKEKQVASMAITGMANGEIAQRIRTTEQVVKNHMRKILDKTGMSNRTELAYKVLTTPHLCAEFLPMCEEARMAA